MATSTAVVVFVGVEQDMPHSLVGQPIFKARQALIRF